MNLFRDILKGIEEKLQLQQGDVEKIRTLLVAELGVEIEKNNISVKQKILTVTVPALLRHEMIIQKEHLLEVLRKNHITIHTLIVKVL